MAYSLNENGLFSRREFPHGYTCKLISKKRHISWQQVRWGKVISLQAYAPLHSIKRKINPAISPNHTSNALFYLACMVWGNSRTHAVKKVSDSHARHKTINKWRDTPYQNGRSSALCSAGADCAGGNGAIEAFIGPWPAIGSAPMGGMPACIWATLRFTAHAVILLNSCRKGR